MNIERIKRLYRENCDIYSQIIKKPVWDTFGDLPDEVTNVTSMSEAKFIESIQFLIKNILDPRFELREDIRDAAQIINNPLKYEWNIDNEIYICKLSGKIVGAVHENYEGGRYYTAVIYKPHTTKNCSTIEEAMSVVELVMDTWYQGLGKTILTDKGTK